MSKQYVLQALQDINTNVKNYKDEIINEIIDISENKIGNNNDNDITLFGKLNKLITSLGINDSSGSSSGSIYDIITNINDYIGELPDDIKNEFNIDTMSDLLKLLVNNIIYNKVNPKAGSIATAIDSTAVDLIKRDDIAIKPKIMYENWMTNKYEGTSLSNSDVNTTRSSGKSLEEKIHFIIHQLGLSSNYNNNAAYYFHDILYNVLKIKEATIYDESNESTDPNAPKSVGQLIIDLTESLQNFINSFKNDNGVSNPNNPNATINSILCDNISDWVVNKIFNIADTVSTLNDKSIMIRTLQKFMPILSEYIESNSSIDEDTIYGKLIKAISDKMINELFKYDSTNSNNTSTIIKAIQNSITNNIKTNTDLLDAIANKVTNAIKTDKSENNIINTITNNISPIWKSVVHSLSSVKDGGSSTITITGSGILTLGLKFSRGLTNVDVSITDSNNKKIIDSSYNSISETASVFILGNSQLNFENNSLLPIDSSNDEEKLYLNYPIIKSNIINITNGCTITIRHAHNNVNPNIVLGSLKLCIMYNGNFNFGSFTTTA